MSCTKAEFRKQKEALEKQKADNAALQEKINEASMATNKDPGAPKVPKPKGTAGTDYSIQIEMGLSGTTKKKAKYLSIMVGRTSISCYPTLTDFSDSGFCAISPWRHALTGRSHGRKFLCGKGQIYWML